MLKRKDIQLRHVESLWFKTWKNNPEIQGLIQHLHSIYIQYDIQLDCEYLTTQLDPRWTMKLQHLQTIQTPHCKRMSKTYENMASWHAAAFSDSAEPTTHQALAPSAPIWLDSKLMHVTDSFIFSASAKAWRQRQIKVGVSFVGPSDKTWLLKCSKKGHSTETCRISLIQNLEKQSRNPRFHSASTYSMTYSWIRSIWQLNSIRDERWNYSTCKPSKLLTVRGCRKHDIMTCRSIQRFCGAHHTPGLGALRTNAIACHIDVSDALVDFKCLGQGLEAATDQGWRLVRGPFRQNLITEMLKKRTFNWDMSNLSDSKLGKTIQKSRVWFSIYIFADNLTRSKMNDETTAPPNHQNFLSKDVGNVTSWHAAAFSGAHHTPGLGALGTNPVASQTDFCDGRVCLQHLG